MLLGTIQRVSKLHACWGKELHLVLDTFQIMLVLKFQVSLHYCWIIIIKSVLNLLFILMIKRYWISFIFRQVCCWLCSGLQWIFSRFDAYLWNISSWNWKIQAVVILIVIVEHWTFCMQKNFYIYDVYSVNNECL